MTESHQGLVFVGLVQPMAYPETMSDEGLVVETLRRVALDSFFSAVEVRRSGRPDTLEAERRIITEAMLEVIVAGQPTLLQGKLNLNALDEAARQAAVADVRKSVDEAYALGARIVAVLSGPDPGVADSGAALDALTRSLIELCEYARDKAVASPPVFISVETFDQTVDKKCLLGPTTVAAQLISRVKESVDNIGLTVDLSHLPLLNESAAEALAAARPHLIHVHIGNAYFDREDDPAYGDQHPRFGYPGSANGVVELTRFLKALREIDYLHAAVPTRQPVISFEIKPVPGEDSDLIIAGAKRVFEEAWRAA